MCVTDCPVDQHDAFTSYLFTDGRSGREGLLGRIIERGPLLGLLTIMFLVVGSFGLYIWGREERTLNGTLALVALIMLGSLWNYLWFVMEVRVTQQCLSLRRSGSFRSIPWDQILSVRVYNLRTMGMAYVWIAGSSFLPLALFPLWIPWYRPERQSELNRLIEQLAGRLPVRHKA